MSKSQVKMGISHPFHIQFCRDELTAFQVGFRSYRWISIPVFLKRQIKNFFCCLYNQDIEFDIDFKKSKIWTIYFMKQFWLEEMAIYATDLPLLVTDSFNLIIICKVDDIIP